MVAAPLGTARARHSVTRYAVGVVVLVLAVSSQYFVPELWPASRLVYGSLAGDVTIVYGLPILAFALLVGADPLRGWRSQMGKAAVVGPGWYGAMWLLAVVVLVGLIAIYEAVDPGALQLLNRPNPALQAASGDPWFFVGFSFVVGAAEETIFRGWVFGFWNGRTARWLTPAVLSSALFASLHVYYGTTYGIAAPLIFPTLFLLGFAFAATYRDTGGNLVAPALLHGANDATAYLGLIALTAATELRWGIILVGALMGLLYYLIPKPTPAAAAGQPPS